MNFNFLITRTNKFMAMAVKKAGDTLGAQCGKWTFVGQYGHCCRCTFVGQYSVGQCCNCTFVGLTS